VLDAHDARVAHALRDAEAVDGPSSWTASAPDAPGTRNCAAVKRPPGVRPASWRAMV
jgi:hypothetical protein